MKTCDVLIGNSGGPLDEHFQLLVKSRLPPGTHARFTCSEQLEELIEARRTKPFDLYVLVLNNIRVPNDTVEGVACRLDRVIDFVRDTKKLTGKPVVAFSSWVPRGFSTKVEQAGADVFLNVPFQIEPFLELLDLCFSFPTDA